MGTFKPLNSVFLLDASVSIFFVENDVQAKSRYLHVAEFGRLHMYVTCTEG